MLIEIRKKLPLKRGGTYEEEYYIEYGIHFLNDDNRHDINYSSAIVTINGASFGWTIQSNIDNDDIKNSH